MPGKNWTTAEQLSFLESQIPAFLKAQSEHHLPNFYTVVTHQFFTQWSERALRFPPRIGETTRTLTGSEQLLLSSFIIRRKEVRYEYYHAMMYILTSTLIQQIRAWFPWHSKTQLRRKPTLSSLQAFGQVNHKTRLKQATEVYSSLYYESKIKPRVLQEKGDRILSRADNLSLIKTITLQLYAAETAEVKQEVAERVRKLKEIREKEKADEYDGNENEDGTPSSSSERRPEEYQQYVHIHSLHTLYSQPQKGRFRTLYPCLDRC